MQNQSVSTIKTKKQAQERKLNFPEGSTPHGSIYMPQMKRVYDKDLDRKVVKAVKKINIYEYIQSSASVADINQLRAQYLKTGAVPNFNADLVNGVSPLGAENIHELYKMVNGAKDSFATLDPKIQAIFGDADKFVDSLIAGTANKILLEGLTKDAQPAPIPTPTPNEGGAE